MSRPVLRVEFEDAADFSREFSANLGKGGVFVETTESVELREMVEVEMGLCGLAHTVRLSGEVVHIVPPEMSGAGGRPGVAIQFTCSTSALRKMLEPFTNAAGATESEPSDPGRRRSARAPAQIPIQIEHNDNTVMGHTRNLSQTGALVSVPGEGFPSGDRIVVALSHPTRGDSICVDAIVVREVAAEGGVVAIAIEFDPSGPQRETLHRFIQDLQSTEHARRLGGIHGTIDEVGVPNLLQMFASSAPMGTLTLLRGDEEAVVSFEKGLLRHARMGSATGLKALIRLMGWTDGAFEFHARIQATDDTGAPLPMDAAMLDATRQLDEMKQLDLSHLPFDAHLSFVSAPSGQNSGATEKVEQAVLDLAQANFTIRRILDVIPEPDPEVLKAISFLAELGAVVVEPN
jgi:Tfp pilus assembly protein PilZ